jgi:hypothetical protein
MNKSASPQRKTKPQPPASRLEKVPAAPRPKTPYPGYMTDDWFAYLRYRLTRVTPAQARATLIKAGIHDENGQLTAPYRAD